MAERHANRLIALGLLWAFGVTLLRGLRRPNDWAEAHWLIGYDFGLIKRGLPATLLRPFTAASAERAEMAITVVATILTALLCLVLISVCGSILRRAGFSRNAVVAVAVFATSPFVVMTGHLNGYFDAPIILLTALAVALTWRGRAGWAAVALTIGLLVHETIFIIGFPTVVWAALLANWRDGLTGRPAARRLAPLAAPLLAFAALFVYQSFAIDAATLERTLIAHLETFPFIQYDQEVIVPRAFAKSFVAHFQSQSPRVWGRLFDGGLIVAVLPTVAVWLLFIRQALRAANTPRHLAVTAGLLPFLPLALHLIAWDTARIWTYPVIVALLVGWVACLAAEPARLRAADSRLLTLLGLLALPLNVFGRVPLMDWRVERFTVLWRAALYVPLLAVLAGSAILQNRAASLRSGRSATILPPFDN
ncbi:MAG: hypothetical protein KA170_14305 [Candidatus Promineofilum sp.]|nr:hypothetical protein [Promineifilum sp.]